MEYYDEINPRYSEVLYNLMQNEQTKPLLDAALSTYPLYVAKSEHIYGIPNTIPTREELNQKILNAYKYREIGFETVGRFLDELQIAMEEIMPRYNQLFFSADQDFNVIYNVDYQRTIDRTREGENTSTSNTSDTTNQNTETSTEMESFDKHIHSETPQNDIHTANTAIDQVSYADNIDWGKNNSSETGETTGETTSTGQATSEGTAAENEQTLETTKGNFGVVSAQDLILKYRETILNIVQMIIDDERISELFMRVY